MRVAVFSSKPYDEKYLGAAAEGSDHQLDFFEAKLNCDTLPLAAGYDAVCVFVHDEVNGKVLRELAEGGTRLVALRAAGFNNVDLDVAQEVGIRVGRVPAYSPYAVAEHSVALILSLVRRTYRAYNRVRDGNFALDGLLGYDLHDRCVGVIGTGRIGTVFARIMSGFGCRLMAYDPYPNDAMRELGAKYVDLPELFAESEIIALHAPLTPETHHIVNRESLELVKPGVMIVNTSRGGLIDTEAAIEALKDGRLGYLGLDVYEEEHALGFFEDLSQDIIQDDTFARLLTFPNVLITAHQGFFTEEALESIADTTIANLSAFEHDGAPLHEVSADSVG
ncbi:MAG: 2-hydroxyacid dehydrogenase [Chloroflexota bacterium]|nr:2-hydroxyacid dehydrogenase [Chloroflexota bacterium]